MIRTCLIRFLERPIGLLLVGCCLFSACATTPSTPDRAGGPETAPVLEAGGIKVVRISFAMNGMMLDLRYRVTDFEQARKILKKDTVLTLTDQATGVVLPVPNMAKVGKLRQLANDNETWRIYWVFFNNSMQVVKKGSKVTLAIGNVKIRDIPVE